MFVAAIIGGVGAIGGALINRNATNRANAQAAANAAEAQQVDWTSLSPEGRARLNSLFGKAETLAGSVFDGDFTRIRDEMTAEGMQAQITQALNSQVPVLKATMGKAGAYNSTSFALARESAVADAAAKGFVVSQSAANERIASELNVLNPLLQLLQIDKGSTQVGKVAGSAAPVIPNTVSNTTLGSVTQGIGGVLGNIFGNKDPWATKGPGE